jgi:YhcN/YlaJ family sporulation lipoprotein
MKLKLYSMAIVFVLLLVGCNNGQDNTNDNIEPTRFNGDNMNNRDNRDQGTGMRQDGTTNINNRNVNNENDRNDQNNSQQEDNYEISEEAADRITNEIAEINDAYVLTTNNNAYVAAVLDNDDRHDNGNNNRDNIGRNNENTNNTGNNMNENVNRANDNGAELTDEVKGKITDIVQSVDNNIENVYVTTNPDFADLTNNYMNDLNNGKPVRGFFDQIGNMIERVFPQNQR